METYGVDTSHVNPSCPPAAAYSLFIVFGVGSWLTVNGLFSEIPLIMHKLPEGDHFPASLGLAIQLGNIGPLLFLQVRKMLRRSHASKQDGRLETFTIYLILVIGALAMAALAAFWRVTARIAGSDSSVVCLGLAVVAAVSDCTSSLLFFQFAGSFGTLYLAALAVGEGMSGAVTSFFTYIQNVSSDDPNFGPGTYFILLSITLLVCLLAFHILRTARFSNVERRAMMASEGNSQHSPDPLVRIDEPTRNREAMWLLVLQAWIAFLMNGVSISCIPIAANRYNKDTLQWATTLTLVIDPLAVAVGYYLPIRAAWLIPICYCFSVSQAYVFALSFKVTPPSFAEAMGSLFFICNAGFGRALMAYTKMRVNVLLKGIPIRKSDALLMWSGVAMQVGSFSGAITLYILVTFTTWFCHSW
eukprot:TRINITY_DN61681_c0_g1_i1.p1 TRINITY_DN61681_c0_g1~~TRINITY_DN61681_c0_g1_i1.p1  ORF type:complete len:438 (+),score=39.23 TRINITY_DN61681_c0_g1_i1:68-1315(+)